MPHARHQWPRSRFARWMFPWSRALATDAAVRHTGRERGDYGKTCRAIGNASQVWRRTTTREGWADGPPHLRAEAVARPAPRPLARGIPFLRNFFGWLASGGIPAGDPSAQTALPRPIPPLPELLFEDEVLQLEEAAA